MTSRKPLRMRPQFDALERRETPSSGMGGALADIAAAHPAVQVRRHRVSISGSGTATLASITPSGNGETVTGTIRGTLNGSTMGGTVTAHVSTTRRGMSITGTATLATAAGDLNIAFVSTRGRNMFTAAGGTAIYAGARGRGQLSGSVDTTAQTLAFSFHGNITTRA